MSEFEEGGLESLASWFKTNQRIVSVGLGGIALAVVGGFVWQKSAETKIQNAERAFFQAQSATSQNPGSAVQELDKVAIRYAGTSAGDRASLLLAQSLMTQGKTADALKKLEALSSSGGASRLGATLQTLMAAAYEGLNRPSDAAKAYLAAAATSVGDAKIQREADAARAYSSAGNTTEALRIWTELARNENGPLAAEAHVRLGELAVKQ